MVDTALPARTEWLGDFAKLRPSDFGVMAAPPVAAAGAEGAGTSQQQTQDPPHPHKALYVRMHTHISYIRCLSFLHIT